MINSLGLMFTFIFFTLPICLVSTLVFIYYSRQQKTYLFEQKVEAESRAIRTKESLINLMNDIGCQYNEELRRFIIWFYDNRTIEKIEDVPKSFTDWVPEINIDSIYRTSLYGDQE